MYYAHNIVTMKEKRDAIINKKHTRYILAPLITFDRVEKIKKISQYATSYISASDALKQASINTVINIPRTLSSGRIYL